MAVLLFQKFRVGIFKKIPSSEQEIKQGAKGVKIRFERRLLVTSPAVVYEASSRQAVNWIIERQPTNEPVGCR